MFSYHNHTTFSDGYSDPEEIIIAARNSKLKEVGISDHFTLFPDGTTADWSMPADKVETYFKTLEKLKELYSERIIIRKGIEVDYFKENIDSVFSNISKYNPDYIIGAIHFVDDFAIDESKESWEALSKDEIDAVIVKYWEKLIDMVNSKKIDIVAHMDLYKKFGKLTDTDFSEYCIKALDAIEANGLCMEINTSKMNVEVNGCYPSKRILEFMKDKNIPIIITSDAHYPIHIVRDFPDASKMLKELGFKITCKFENRKKIIEDLK